MNQTHRAAKVGAVVDLRSVSLRSVDARLPDVATGDAGIELEMSWETELLPSEHPTLAYLFRLSLGSRSGPDIHVVCEYELLYELAVEENGDVGIGVDELAAFGEVSVTFSAFPYARELVQSLTTRASMTPLVLGTLRAPIDPPPVEEPDG